MCSTSYNLYGEILGLDYFDGSIFEIHLRGSLGIDR
jgi:hypothetical protein